MKFSWRCHVSLVKFSYWSKFHVNIVTGCGVTTIFVCNGLTRDPETGNTPVSVFPNIWRLGQVKDTKNGTNLSNKKLLNPTKCQGYTICRFCVIIPTGSVKLCPSPPTSRLLLLDFCLFIVQYYHYSVLLSPYASWKLIN